MSWLAASGGGLLVLFTLADIFMTVLYARSSTGLVTPRLSKGVWRIFKAASWGSGSDRLLTFAGPTVLVVTVAFWIALLMAGFALIAWPALGSGIRASQGATPTDFVTALYYSGYSLTTLGTGDLVPQAPAYRLMMVTEAFVGFSVLTLTLTYLMSVYSALIRRNVLAQALHQLSEGTADAAEIVARLGPDETFTGARELVDDLAFRVLDLLESHHSYPVLHYFRRQDPRYALARIVLLVLDTAALLRLALPERCRPLSEGAAVSLLWRSGLSLLDDLGSSFLPERALVEQRRLVREEDSRRRWKRALDRLRAAGIGTPAGREGGSAAYHAARGQWEGHARAFASMMAYPWSQIEPPPEAFRDGRGSSPTADGHPRL